MKYLIAVFLDQIMVPLDYSFGLLIKGHAIASLYYLLKSKVSYLIIVAVAINFGLVAGVITWASFILTSVLITLSFDKARVFFPTRKDWDDALKNAESASKVGGYAATLVSNRLNKLAREGKI